MRIPHDLMHGVGRLSARRQLALPIHRLRRARHNPRMIKILSVNVARVAVRLIDGQAVHTAHDKRPATGPVKVGPLGLEGDEQADPTVHGGLSKAIYAYPVLHYPVWQTMREQAKVAQPGEVLAHGALGENLTLQGLDESGMWVGDRWRLPGCELAVSEPRKPCFKFNAAMGFAHASKMMVQSGFCGGYLAVMQPGYLQAGDEIEIIPGPREVNLRELFLAKMKGRRNL